jgi:glycosyltransferase involved in cell wall biosynthesis
MMGWDMRTGLAAARGRTIAVIDGDGQMPAEDVVAVFNCLNAGGFDMAMTYREQRYDGFTRYVISRVYNRTLKTLFPSVSVRDANSKPKIFTRDALDRLALASDGWFIDAEMVIQATRMGFRIGEVATRFHRNSRRRSFVRPKAIIEFAANLVVYRLRTLRR